MTKTELDSIFTKIAEEYLSIPSLEVHEDGDPDYQMVSVWDLRDALEAAYNAGIEADTKPMAATGA